MSFTQFGFYWKFLSEVLNGALFFYFPSMWLCQGVTVRNIKGGKRLLSVWEAAGQSLQGSTIKDHIRLSVERAAPQAEHTLDGNNKHS